MCYNTEYVGYEQKRIKQEHILFMGHAEKIVLVHTPGLRGRELGQRVIEGKGGFPCLNVLVRVTIEPWTDDVKGEIQLVPVI